MFRLFHVHLEAVFPWALAFCLRRAIFRFYIKNGIPFLIKTFDPNFVAKCYVYIVWVFFFFQYLTMAFLDIKSWAFWIRDTLKTGSETSEYGLSVHNRSHLACLELLVKNSLRTWGWVALKLPLGCRTGTLVQIRSESTPSQRHDTRQVRSRILTFRFHCHIQGPVSKQTPLYRLQGAA